MPYRGGDSLAQRLRLRPPPHRTVEEYYEPVSLKLQHIMKQNYPVTRSSYAARLSILSILPCQCQSLYWIH